MNNVPVSHESFYFVPGDPSQCAPDEFEDMRHMLWNIAHQITESRSAILSVRETPDDQGRYVCEVRRAQPPLNREEIVHIGRITVATWNSALAIRYGLEPNDAYFDTLVGL